MPATRSASTTALFNLISGAYAWGSDPSRRVKLWGDVDVSLMPAFFQGEGDPDLYVYASQTILASIKRTVQVKLIIYLNAKEVPGAPQVNSVLDAIDAAIYSATDSTGKNTLGGTCDSCRIKSVFKDPGDLDGIGMVVVDVEILLP